jgi:hypothetical protein
MKDTLFATLWPGYKPEYFSSCEYIEEKGLEEKLQN